MKTKQQIKAIEERTNQNGRRWLPVPSVKRHRVVGCQLMMASALCLSGTAWADQSFNRSKSWSSGGGHFAVSASAQVYDDYEPGERHAIYQKAHANARVFGRSRTLASANTSFQANYKTGAGRAQAALKIFGRTYGSIDRAFSSSTAFGVTPIVKRTTIADKWFTVGWIPVRVRAGASVSLGGQVKIGLTKGTSSVYPTVRGQFAVPLDVAGFAEAGVDAGVAAVGIRGVLSLMKSSLGGAATMRSEILTFSNTRKLFVDHDFDWVLEGLSGKLDVYAKVRYWIGSKTWTKTLASWTGLRTVIDLASGASQVGSVSTGPLPNYLGSHWLTSWSSGFALAAPTTTSSTDLSASGASYSMAQ